MCEGICTCFLHFFSGSFSSVCFILFCLSLSFLILLLFLDKYFITRCSKVVDSDEGEVGRISEELGKKKM